MEKKINLRGELMKHGKNIFDEMFINCRLRLKYLKKINSRSELMNHEKKSFS